MGHPWLPSLRRGEDLDAVAVDQFDRRPKTAGHDRVVDGDGNAFAPTAQAGDHHVDVGTIRQVVGFTVDRHDHPKRSGVNGLINSGASPVRSSSAMASAVTGVSKMPLRKWPQAITS